MSSYAPVLRLDIKLNSPESSKSNNSVLLLQKKILYKDIDILTTKYKIDNQQGPTV